MTIDLGIAYRAARERISAMVVDSDGSLPVPATPAWDLHDVIAHLAGIVDDVRTGNMEGATTDPWTAAQVLRGRAKSVGQLLDEWTQGAALIESFLSSPAGGGAFRAVFDIHTHEADLCNAMGLQARLPVAVVDWAGGRLLESFHEAVEHRGLPPVSVTAPSFEVLRGRLGRRTPAEISAYEWSADPATYVDTWFVFGRRTESLAEMAPALFASEEV